MGNKYKQLCDYIHKQCKQLEQIDQFTKSNDYKEIKTFVSTILDSLTELFNELPNLV